MPAPRSIARFNRRFTNRLFLRVAGHLPGFAIVSHVGRKSGRTYRTPVNAFRANDRYIIALTYGSESYLDNLLSTTPVPSRVSRTGARDGEQYKKSDANKTSTR